MQPKHTPGPWIADVRNETCAYLEGPPRSYEECYFRNAADARLIAAAPELLDALEWILNNKGAHIENVYQVVRAAIAKATGSSDAA